MLAFRLLRSPPVTPPPHADFLAACICFEDLRSAEGLFWAGQAGVPESTKRGKEMDLLFYSSLWRWLLLSCVHDQTVYICACECVYGGDLEGHLSYLEFKVFSQTARVRVGLCLCVCYFPFYLQQSLDWDFGIAVHGLKSGILTWKCH